MGDDDEYELSDFEKLISGKIGKVQMEHYKDVGYPDGRGADYNAWAAIGWRMNAQYAVEGKELYREPYEGATPEQFFKDYPEVKKILDDPEIASIREKN